MQINRYGKKYTFLIMLLSIMVFSSCFTARQYPYDFSERNKTVIKQVFISGTVSCAPTPNGKNCWIIKNEQSNNTGYFINGTRKSNMEITLKAIQSKKKTPSFITYIKITNGKVRLWKLETLFLEELGNNLFNENKMDIEKRLEIIFKEEFKEPRT